MHAHNNNLTGNDIIQNNTKQPTGKFMFNNTPRCNQVAFCKLINSKVNIGHYMYVASGQDSLVPPPQWT